MKFVLSGIALACALGAHASFDLMLLPGNDDRIYRYDPVNRLMLGSYATSGTGKIAASIAGRSYTTGGSSNLQMHNYSTGNHAGYLSSATSNRGVELCGDSVYVLSLSQLRKTVTATNSSTVISLGTLIVWHTLASFGSTIVAIGTNTANQISFQNIDLTTFTAGSVITTSNTATVGSSLGKAAAVANPFTGTPTLIFSFVNGASVNFARVSLSTTGVVSAASALTGALNNFSATNFMPGFSAGHAGGFWAYGQDSITATNGRVTRYDMTTSSLVQGETNTFASPGGVYTTGIFHAANVVAPEPGVFLGLGLGVVGLLRRRKRLWGRM